MARSISAFVTASLMTLGLSVTPSAWASGDIEDTTEMEHINTPQKPPPSWLAVPMISSDPKIGTSLGAMASYLFKIDPESTSSMVGIGGTYTSTDSTIGGIFLRSFWDGDSKRLLGAIGTGKINNDYDDFLGSGLPAETSDTLKLAQVRYLQEVRPNWFAGVQATYTNYLISSEDFLVNEVLKVAGLTGYDSVGVGLVAMFDDRNSPNGATEGRRFMASNFAYREALGGEESFDTYKMDYRQYIPHGEGHVLAYQVAGRWTSDATPSGYSSVNLRGYVRGEYLAPHSASIEVEERFRITERFGMTMFGGVACLYGDGKNCSDKGNLYTSIGIGGQFVLNQAENLMMSFDFAKGENDNQGFYMRFGQSF